MDPFNPLIVFGPSKSGTTWLQRILDAHPEVRCHFQLPVFPFISQEHLAVRTNAVFNKQLSPYKGLFKRNRDEREYYQRLKFFGNFRRNSKEWLEQLKSDNDEAAKYYEQLYLKIYRGMVKEVLCDDSKKKIFGTKSYTDLDFLFKVYPNARVICIIRDGRDVAVSKRYHYWKMGVYFHGEEKSRWLYWVNSNYTTKKIILGLRKYLGWFGEEHFIRQNDPNDFFTKSVLKKVARDWYLTSRYILNFKNKFPDQIHLVQYEDLKSNTEMVIGQMLLFLNADSRLEIITDIMQKTEFKLLQKDQKDSFFRKGIVGDWRNHFNDTDKRIFKTETEGLLTELGYAENENW